MPNYKYYRRCKSCGKEFATNYHNKFYCGNKACEKERIATKNKETHKQRDKLYLKNKGRSYYSANKEKCLIKKSIRYREGKPSTKSYVPGKVDKHNIEYVKEFVERYGYVLLTKEYENNKQKIKLRCGKGHEWTTTFHNFKDNGNRCSTCYTDGNCVSSFELDVRKVLSKVYKGIVDYNDRSIITNPKTGRYLELDLYMPKIKKAIECNGEYWHSSPYSKYKDKIKVKTCRAKGIDLMIITDTEWNNLSNKEKLLTIKRFIGKQ